MIDDAKFDVSCYMVPEHVLDKVSFDEMKELWNVEDDGGECYRDGVGGEYPPVASLSHPGLVGVG